MSQKRRILGMAALMVLVASGCSSGGGDDTGDERAGAESEAAGVGEQCTAGDQGGTLTMGMGTPPPGLDPVIGSSKASGGGIEKAALFDTLVRVDPETGEYEPRLAESLEPNDDFTEWTLTLREGLTFGNGDPVTTEAVVFTLERHQAEGTRSILQELALQIREMEVVDDLQMVFHLTEPWANFPWLLTSGGGMVVNPRLVRERGDEGFNTNPTGGGAGPFELVRYAPGEEIVMEPKDDYWDGPVCLEEVRFVVIAGAQGTYEAFQNSELDVAYMRGDARMSSQIREDEVNVHTNLANGGLMLMLNNGAQGTEPPTADVRLRQAIAYALDPQLVDDRVNEGLGMPTSALLTEGSLYYDGQEGPPYDPERASELVDELKDEGWDGRVHFVYPTDAPTSEDTAIAIEALLNEVGITVEHDGVPTTTMLSQVRQGADYDICLWPLSLYDSSLWEDLAQRITGEGPLSYGYQDPDMDAALQALRATTDDRGRTEAMARIQEIWNETVPSAILGAVQEDVYWRDGVAGLEFSNDNLTFLDEAHLTD
jgi:peptide/nickel transport system substrate-binding protein